LSFILGGGDDHALLATFPSADLPEGWAAIGSVSAGSGVTVDGGEYDGPTGWTHF
jgi:thiamine-monophosphate kinase